MVLSFLDNLRDILIIMWAFVSVLAIVAIILATLALYIGFRDLLKIVRTTVNEDVRPLLNVSQDSVSNVAGTTRFVSDTVAQPIIRALAFIAGARRAIEVFLGLTGRGRGG